MGSTLGIPTRLGIVLAVLVMLGLAALGLSGTALNPAGVQQAFAAPGVTHQLYLPMFFNFIPGIYGRVMSSGTPMGGVAVVLRLVQGSTITDVATATTNAEGNFFFGSVAPLVTGQRYNVRFIGTAVTDLAYWQTPSTTKFTVGNTVVYSPFDIVNVPLQTPLPKAVVSLPVNFQWQARSGSPSDSYTLFLTDSVSGASFTSPALGNLSTYTLTSLPPGFTAGHAMHWSVKITAPDGGFGQSEESRLITIQ